MNIDARIAHAVPAAQQAFWTALAQAFPEITTGDFPPDATLSFDAACLSAATVWVQGNLPRPEQAVTVVAFDSCLPLEYHAQGVLRRDGSVEVQGEWRHANGSQMEGANNDSGAIDISHVLLQNGDELAIDPATMKVRDR